MGSCYDDWTVKELKEALKERGLPVSGKKRVLIERLESSEGLEGSSRGKNYLEEGALDAEDADLVEQIREKYRAPDYRAPEFDNSVQTKLEIAVITLCLLGLVGLYLFKELDNTSIFLWGLIFSFMVFLMLFARKWSYEMGVTHTIKHTLTGGPILIIAVLLIFVGIEAGGPGYWDADPIVLPYGEMVLPCWSALIIFLVPPIVHMVKDEEERAERIEIRNRKKNAVKERVEKWSKAQKYETDDRFDTAMGIWSKLGEEGEVERVTRLKTECLCIVLKRKIDVVYKMLNGFDKDGVDVKKAFDTLEKAQNTLSEGKFEEAGKDLWNARMIGSKLKEEYGESMEKIDQIKAKIAEFKEKGVNTDKLEKILKKAEKEVKK